MLLTWLDARVAGGELLLRIDDLDSTRARPDFVREIFRVMESLDLDWNLGPHSFEEFEAQFSQKRSQDFYSAAFEEARAAAPELFYACSCSRKDLPSDSAYPGTCRSRGLPLAADGSVSWRVRSDLLPDSARTLGDVILFRKERLFAYQWVSLQEDLRWRITDIHRGEDLRSSTEFQLALSVALAERGLSQYLPFTRTQFIHHPLILGGDKKLSKSEGAQAAARWLDHPERIFAGFLKWIGWQDSGEVRTSRGLLALYRSRKVNGIDPSFSAQFQLFQLMD
jgi:glutamyl/glutaminyl-tRNA synthetase